MAARASGPYDLILDSVGGATLASALTMLRTAGTCVTYGVSEAPTTTFETCQRSPRTSAERTIPVLPTTMSATAGTINASGFHSAPSCAWRA